MRALYRISSTVDRNTNSSKGIYGWNKGLFYIQNITLGRNGHLYSMESNKSLITSGVESIQIHEDGIRIETKNTIYYLELAGYKLGEELCLKKSLL